MNAGPARTRNNSPRQLVQSLVPESEGCFVSLPIVLLCHMCCLNSRWQVSLQIKTTCPRIPGETFYHLLHSYEETNGSFVLQSEQEVTETETHPVAYDTILCLVLRR